MKYRIKSSRRTPSESKHLLPIKRIKRSLRLCPPTRLPIDAADLFGFGIFYDPYSSYAPRSARVKMRSRPSFFSRAIAYANTLSFRLRVKILALALKRKARPSLLPAIFGSLCAALAVAFLSLGFVIYSLFIKDYFGAYENVVVPSFVGIPYSENSVPIDSEYYKLHISYKHSKELPEGYVISQTPSEGVMRRVYENGDPCDIFLVISLGEKLFTMNDYSSFELRDAMLELKNEAIRISVKHLYSSEIEQGKIISTSPSVGESFSEEDTVTLTVSLGPEKIYVTVPNLYALTETRAEEVLRAAGLRVGKVSYIQSERPVGSVISQSHSFGTTAEKDTEISFAVSAGIKYNEKKMPDLYGLSIDEARNKLAEYGLVIGNVYGVANGAPKGTVISQSLLPQTPITSGIISIDIYVSS